MQKTALMSVNKKRGAVALARALRGAGYHVLATDGTAAHLQKNGVRVQRVGAYTGVGEWFGGKVKTLHPKVFAGILADRGNPADMKALEKKKWNPIDLVVVNFKPAEPNAWDVGGPALVSAAAKNRGHVVVVTDARDYRAVAKEIEWGGVTDKTRRALANNAMERVLNYHNEVVKQLRRTTTN